MNKYRKYRIALNVATLLALGGIATYVIQTSERFDFASALVGSTFVWGFETFNRLLGLLFDEKE